MYVKCMYPYPCVIHNIHTDCVVSSHVKVFNIWLVPGTVHCVRCTVRGGVSLCVGVRPLAVVGLTTGLVRALECVASEKVALRLCQVGGEARPSVRIKVRERGAHGRAGDARRDAERHDAAPARLARVDLARKLAVHEQ